MIVLTTVFLVIELTDHIGVKFPLLEPNRQCETNQLHKFQKATKLGHLLQPSYSLEGLLQYVIIEMERYQDETIILWKHGRSIYVSSSGGRSLRVH